MKETEKAIGQELRMSLHPPSSIRRGKGLHFRSTDCSAWLVVLPDGTINPLTYPCCDFDPDS